MRKRVSHLQSTRSRTPQTNKSDKRSANPKPQLGWFAGVAIVIVAFAVGYSILEMRNRLVLLDGALGRMSDAAKRAQSEIFALKEQLGRTKIERSALQSQLVKATSRSKQLHAEMEVAEAALDDRRALFTNMQDEVTGAAHAKAKAQTAGIGEMVASLETKFGQGKGRRVGLTAKIESLWSDVERLRMQLAISQRRPLSLRDNLTRIEGELQGLKETAEKAVAEATALKSQATIQNIEIEVGRAERDALQKKLGQAKAYIEQLKDNSLNAPLTEPGAAGAALHSACEARDYLIRTIVFEGSGETEIGKIAIGYVVLNRKRSGRWGGSIEDVVTSPWQFEPWMTRRKAMKNLAATDPGYRDAARIADKILMGDVADPTEGATHFLNPVIVRQRRGGTLPAWANDNGQPIGRHVFYTPSSDPASVQGSETGQSESTALNQQVPRVAGARWGLPAF